MKLLGLLFAIFTLWSMPASAGVRAYNGITDLKLFEAIKCSTGMTCSKEGAKLLIRSLPGAIQTRQQATATTATSAQCGSTFYNAGAVEVDLPDADVNLGCRYTFITLNASNFDIDPDAADRIFALTDANGDKVRNATVGNSVTLEAVAGGWAAVGIYGTWSDAN